MAASGNAMGIAFKSARQIEIIRRAGCVVAEALVEISRMLRPGVTTRDVNRAAERVIERHGGEPIFKTEAGFPTAACVSVNEQVVHGVPGRRRLKEGDIVSVDVGTRLGGYVGDAAWTFPVCVVSVEAKRLLRGGDECLWLAIEEARPGNPLEAVSRAIQRHAETNGYSTVRAFVGHGVGEKLHEEPQVPNYVPEEGIKVTLRPGTVIAIEPMVNGGSYEIKRLRDGWTVVTIDGRLSAHFEHTVAVTADGSDVLTTCPEMEFAQR